MPEVTDYIRCPLCGKGIHNTKAHMNRTHKDMGGYNKFSDLYPNHEKYSQYYIEQRRGIMVNLNKDSEFIKKRDAHKELPGYKEKKAETARKNIAVVNNNPELRSKLNEQASERMIRYNKSPEGIARARRCMLKRHEDPAFTQKLAKYGNIGNRSYYTIPSGRTVCLRSDLEKLILQGLDSFQIQYEYENLSIPYVYEGQEHRYIPDISIGNLILEVKPKNLWSEEITIEKRCAAIAAGYEFEFVDGLNTLASIVEQRLSKVRHPHSQKCVNDSE